ncbi:hypothetical protein NPIL_625931, partial [Nephila pilipes]
MPLPEDTGEMSSVCKVAKKTFSRINNLKNDVDIHAN